MRTVLSASKPAWANPDKTIIDLYVLFEELQDTFGELPFSATADAAEDYTRELFANAVKGDYGDIAEYAAPVYTAEQLDAQARAWRDGQITDSQWLIERHRDQVDAGTATTLTAAQYSALLVYRQKLRDWPTVANFPADSTKPAAPDWLAAAEAVDEDV
jgi:hypothetical protein